MREHKLNIRNKRQPDYLNVFYFGYCAKQLQLFHY